MAGRRGGAGRLRGDGAAEGGAREDKIVCLSRCLLLPLSSESHFRLETGRVVGLTDVGRTTVFLLEMNADQRIDLRLVNQDGMAGEGA